VAPSKAKGAGDPREQATCAKHLEWMRNWLGVYTPTVTLVFIMFAVLGYRSLSDIEINRKKVESIAGQVELDAGKAEKLVKNVGDTLYSSQQAVQQFQTQVQGLQASQTALKSDYDGLRATSTQIEQRELSKSQELTSSSLSSSISFTSGLGHIVSNALNVPLIQSVSVAGETMSIEGFGFGSSSGRVLIKKNVNAGVLMLGDLAAESGAVEIPSGSISSWSTNKIVCSSSEIRMPDTLGSMSQVQVTTNSGSKSNVYSVYPQLLPSVRGIASQ